VPGEIDVAGREGCDRRVTVGQRIGPFVRAQVGSRIRDQRSRGGGRDDVDAVLSRRRERRGCRDALVDRELESAVGALPAGTILRNKGVVGSPVIENGVAVWQVSRRCCRC